MDAVSVNERLSNAPVDVTIAAWVLSSEKLPVESLSATDTDTVPSPMAVPLSHAPGLMVVRQSVLFLMSQ